MLFVVRRLQELGRQRKIPLYKCFIDLQKAYFSVGRELLWKVLARAGVPSVMIDVIRQLHDGMRARVRMDDGELSEWFEVTQGLRQGCVLSPLLFNIFFAAVMEVALREEEERTEDDEVLGAYGRDELNDNGKRLLNFVTDNKLAVTNIFFSTRKGGISRTYDGVIGDRAGDFKRIDYILTRQTHRPRVHRIVIHLLSAVRALIFLATMIRPFLSLADREVEYYVLTI